MESDDTLRRFSYADYERTIRAPFYEALWRVTRLNASFFKDCQRVLDLASGQGFLLDVLKEMGVPAYGVDNEADLVKSCRARGLNVIQDDLFHFLKTTKERFDGLSCNHIIEHMPYESFLDLIEGTQRVLEVDGLFVVTWPNPRSAITQFEIFWKDPTHSRFYDGEFVKAVLVFYGFEIVETFYDTPTPHMAPGDGTASGTLPPQVLGRHGLLRKLKHRVREGLIRASGLSTLVEQHRTAQQRLKAFDLPTDARIVARRKSQVPVDV